MRPIILLLAWLAMTASAYGEIVVPKEVVSGEPIVVVVKPDNLPPGAVAGGGSIAIRGAQVLPGPNPNEWHVWAQPKATPYEILATGAWAVPEELDNGGTKKTVYTAFGSYLLLGEFTVKGATPPNPPPPPVPVPTSEIAVKVRELLGQVQGETRAAEAAKLADWLAAAAKEIATASDPLSQTKLVTPEAALAALDANATSILGDRRASWAPFFDGLKTFMERIINVEKKLPNTVFGIGQAFEEIATGLRAQAVTPSHASVAAPTSIEGHAVQTPTASDPSSPKSSSSSQKSTGSSRRGLFGRIR